MTSGPGNIPAPLIALAGFLAERAVTELLLTDIDGAHALLARETDLPRRLWEATGRGSVTLSAGHIGIELLISRDSATWKCRHPTDAVALARVFANA